MNLKSLLIILAVLVLVNISAFYFLKGNNNYSPSKPLQKSPDTITAPVSLNHSGLNSVRLVYTFQGKVAEKTAVGANFNIKLDINSGLPEFLATSNTIILDAKNPGIPVRTSIDDIKLGSKVELNASYDLRKYTWNLDVITVQSEIIPSLQK